LCVKQLLQIAAKGQGSQLRQQAETLVYGQKAQSNQHCAKTKDYRQNSTLAA